MSDVLWEVGVSRFVHAAQWFFQAVEDDIERDPVRYVITAAFIGIAAAAIVIIAHGRA